MDVLVIGGGPAGMAAALRSAELGARTRLVTRGRFGGMAANDGPVPVRTLAYAAHRLRLASDLATHGIDAGTPRLDFGALLGRVRDVVELVTDQSTIRGQAERLGVEIVESANPARFLDARSVALPDGRAFAADRIILCAGGKSRRLIVPGAELTATHSDAWGLTEVPASLIVIGGGMTGLQVASIFQAFGSRVDLFQVGKGILPGEDGDVSRAVAAGLRESGMGVHEAIGAIERFEKTPAGVRMRYREGDVARTAEASLVVTAIGWVADTGELGLEAAGVERNERGYVRVDRTMRTTAPGIFAAGDITGRTMLLPPAIQDGYVAATNAVTDSAIERDERFCPIGGFTEPEYARVGLTEEAARREHDVVTATVRFDETTRTIIDGRTHGFCKLVVDRAAGTILGCHVVGDRAIDIVQAATLAMKGSLPVGEIARLPLAFPTYTGVLARVAYRAARTIDPRFAAPGFADPA